MEESVPVLANIEGLIKAKNKLSGLLEIVPTQADLDRALGSLGGDGNPSSGVVSNLFAHRNAVDGAIIAANASVFGQVDGRGVFFVPSGDPNTVVSSIANYDFFTTEDFDDNSDYDLVNEKFVFPANGKNYLFKIQAEIANLNASDLALVNSKAVVSVAMFVLKASTNTIRMFFVKSSLPGTDAGGLIQTPLLEQIITTASSPSSINSGDTVIFRIMLQDHTDKALVKARLKGDKTKTFLQVLEQ